MLAQLRREPRSLPRLSGPRGAQRVPEEARNRHRPHAPGTGVAQDARAIASENATSPTSFPSAVRLMPTVDDDGALLNPVAAHQLRAPNGCDEHVRLATARAEVARLRVRNRRRGVLGEEQVRHRGKPHDVAATDDTARAPASATPASRSSRMQPMGVHGASAGRPDTRYPTFAGWRPVDVLPR